MNFINTDTDDYPVTREAIEVANPTVIFSDENPPAPFKPVLPALSPPTPDDDEVLVEGAPALVSGTWRQTWSTATKVVTSITSYQAAQQLYANGGTLAAMQALVDGSGDEELKFWWSKATVYERDNPNVETLRVLLYTVTGLTQFGTQAGMDAFFLAASAW